MDHGSKANMLNVILKNSAVKQGLFALLALWIYISIGVCRTYVSLLFYQVQLPDSKLHLDENETTWIASCVGLLSPFGSLLSGFLMDVIGRKKCVQLMFVPFVISWIIVSFASSYMMLLIGMLIGSIGLGMGMCIITYVSEISAKEYRGMLVAGVDLTFNFGAILCNILMYFLKWDTVSMIFAACTGISLCLTFLLPESPLWLYSKGKKEKAINILCDIRCKNAEELQDEIKDLEKSHSTETEKTGFMQTIKNCLHGWKQFTIASTFFILLILAGPFVVRSYTVIILEYLKVSYNTALITVIYSIASFGGSLMTPFFVHKCKRKILLTISAGGMALGMLVIGIYVEIFFHSKDKPCPWIIPVAICLYAILCNIGVLPVGFVIGGELFPIEARGALQGIFGFLIGTTWTVSLKLYPIVLFDFGIGALIWAFTVSAIFLTLFAMFILPETKDKSLAEIQEQYFNKKKNVDKPKV